MASDAWYALRVRSNFERKAEQYLEANGYRTFLPTYRDRRIWSDRIKHVDVPLFAGYVFCSMEITRRFPVMQAPGVVDIVGFGGTYERVPNEQLEAIRRMVSSGLQVRPCPFLNVGDRVRIDHGPLAGLEGILAQIRTEVRFIVSVPLLQRSIAAEVDRAWISRISARS